MDDIFYDALSKEAKSYTEPDTRIYRNPGKPSYGKVLIKSKYTGLIPFKKNTTSVEEYSLDLKFIEYKETNEFNISYTKMGDKGVLVLLLHGVPSNRRFGWENIQRRLSPFCRTIAIDMLGMGESDKPRDYGINQKKENDIFEPWDWKNDVDYIDQIMKKIYGDEKFIFVADDWGSGINTHFAAEKNDRLLAMIQLNPIAFDGYPVSEIQTIGRASKLEDKPFMMAMGNVDQTIVQILKTMVYDQNKFNQYTLRRIKQTYIDTDYDRSKHGPKGEDSTSLTLRLKYQNLRVLADRSAILSPALLLPYHRSKNPKGVKYNKITVPCLIIWGKRDNMMPAQQVHRFANVMYNSRVSITQIENAGHFAAFDQPDWVADAILNFIRQEFGVNNLADIYLGMSNDSIWKGDEEEMIEDLRKIFKKNI
uniref:Haloalkane dehalogenase n=1 Tax=Pithovirus LCPAC104 TaxID=2506589 RepID=A0A481Z565_9VIRU|nr:MAG: haloalkane dehalogenase [Pithovirus LCPAC104]